MMTERDDLQLINQDLHQVQTAQEEAGQCLGVLHQQLNALHQETGERYLAPVRDGYHKTKLK